MIRPRIFRMGRVIPRSRLHPLGPVGLVGPIFAGLALALLAVFTLGIALLFRPRVRPGRPGPEPAPKPGGPAGAGSAGARGGADPGRERSYA